MAIISSFILTLVIGQLVPNIMCRAVNGRHTNKESAIHLNSVQFPLNSYISDEYSLSKPNELILESYDVAHWNKSLFEVFAHTRFLTLMYGNVPNMTFHSYHLETLLVIQTNLTTFEVVAEENEALRILQLVRNKLRNLSGALKFLVGLNTLDVSQNQLTHIDLDLFSTMRKLKNLDLSVNNIASIDASANLRFAKLKNLWISYNQLERFDAFPRSFPRLKTVRLIGNRWSCLWVDRARKDIMERRIVAVGIDYGCSESRQGGLCCYSSTVDTTASIISLLTETPLLEAIQQLTNQLRENPLNISSGDPSLELLTKNGEGDSGKILVGVRRDKVDVFF
ncbi:chaoptin-like [Sabethes cyaneus]|uniref:chaoptin-like n=1 Tax=Sabethes cyaneus TaxID=53552 RepID=UPI00237EAC0B|nr:chaoptin-like [Sabethes cyaneus]